MKLSRLIDASTAYAIPLILALISCGRAPHESGLPESLKIPADLKNEAAKVSGIYPDGWAGNEVSLALQQPAGKNVLSIRGVVPAIRNPDFRAEAIVNIDGQSVLRQSVSIGNFQLFTTIPDRAGKRRVQVTFSAVQQLPAPDGRTISAKFNSIGFESASRPSDIIEGTELALGGNWGERETYHDERFRWVDNNAEIVLTPASSGNEQLTLLVQPGPGIDGPFLLQVLDDSGRRIDAVRVSRRETVTLFLPAEAGKTARFRLHIDGGGKPTSNDSRILNFRVFRIAAEHWQNAGR